MAELISSPVPPNVLLLQKHSDYIHHWYPDTLNQKPIYVHREIPQHPAPCRVILVKQIYREQCKEDYEFVMSEHIRMNGEIEKHTIMNLHCCASWMMMSL